MGNLRDMLEQVTGLSQTDQEQFSLDAFKAIPFAATKKALRNWVAEQPEEKRKEYVSEIVSAIGTSPPIGGPSEQIRDKLWMTVIVAFAFVLAGTFTTLALGVFIKAEGKVTPELILTMFTSVVGFLAGLFVPSPIASKGRTGGN